MCRRGAQLTQVGLRLGLLIGGVVGAWSAYDAVTADVAHAAEPPHTVTVDTGTGSLPSPLSTIVAEWTGTTTNPPQSPDPSEPTSGADDEGTATPSEDPRRVSGPRAPARQRTGSTVGSHLRREGRTPDRGTRCDAPDHRAGRSPTTPRRAGSGATPARGGAPTTVGDRPANKPVVRSPRPVSDHASRGHRAAPRPHGPTPPAADPAPRTPEPTGRPAPSSVDPGADHPAKNKDKGEDGDQDEDEDQGEDKGAGADKDQRPDKDRPTPRTEPAAPAQPVAAAVEEITVTQVTAADMNPAAAGRRSPAGYLEPRRHADAAPIVVNTAPAPRPMRPGVEPAPDMPAPGNSSAGTSHAAHGEAADASAVGWAPLLARGEACRPARADAPSSRSPQPGSRPA